MDPRHTLVNRLLGRFGARLRFPQLFLVFAVLFLLDVLIPDMIPMADEILLGLLTLLLGAWKRRADDTQVADKPPMKDVTPREGRHGH
jgi:hypothetical protein